MLVLGKVHCFVIWNFFLNNEVWSVFFKYLMLVWREFCFWVTWMKCCNHINIWDLLHKMYIPSIMVEHWFFQIIIQYFEPTTTICIMIPWFREMGFAVVYGSLVLKVYRSVPVQHAWMPPLIGIVKSCFKQTFIIYV